MNIQKDWEEVIQKPNEKFWIQEKRADGPTIFGSLCSPLSDVHETAPTDEQQKFIIKNWNKYSLLVQCLVTDTVTRFIAPNKTIKLTEYNKPLLSMDVSPSGELGVCSSVNGELWIWETDTGTNRRVLEGHAGDVDSCRFFPSGLVVLSGASDYRVKIWSIKDGSCARTLTGHTRGITDTCIIEKGRNVISSSRDGTIKLWNCASSNCLFTYCNVSAPINGCGLLSDSSLVSPPGNSPIVDEYCTEGKALWSVSDDGQLRIFDIRNKTMISNYVHNDPAPLMRGVTIDSEDKLIIGNENGELILLDLRHIKSPLKTMRLSSSPICSLCYNNNKVLVGHKNGVCINWSYNDDTLLNDHITGTDIDPISSIVRRHHVTYTSSRDGRVRIYENI